MSDYIGQLLTELRTLVGELGKDGSSISPAIYDTAQVLRLHPPKDGAEPALAWLLAQQQPDGGWGSPETPYARDVPTLATVLTCHTYAHVPHMRVARDAGLEFLRRQSSQWAEIPIDALSSAGEMILPYLIEEAQASGLALDAQPYGAVYKLRNRKLEMIGKRPIRRGSPPSHSWEALRQQVDAILPDSSGSIGLSPAATAAWLRLATKRPELAKSAAMAENYLTCAAAATGLDLPGVVPTAWPIPGFEIAYALYVLLVTGLLMHPALQDVIDPVIDELWLIMRRRRGVSFDENFTPDVDDTAVAVAVLHAKSRLIDPGVILQFKNGDHFCTFHHELNPSILANAHALYGLASTDERYPRAEEFLLKRQCADGRWLFDKWHISWIYNTLEVILALKPLGYPAQITKAREAVLQQQKADGGWGSGQATSRAETSYALLILSTLRQGGRLDAQGENARQRGFLWLSHASHAKKRDEERFWLAKELYAPYRVDRVYELSALLSVALEQIPDEI